VSLTRINPSGESLLPLGEKLFALGEIVFAFGQILLALGEKVFCLREVVLGLGEVEFMFRNFVCRRDVTERRSKTKTLCYFSESGSGSIILHPPTSCYPVKKCFLNPKFS
jgi:hypothetical protein